MSNQKTRPGNGNILLVDDTPSVVRPLNDFLTERGYDVRAVFNGQEALQAAAEDPPEIVLLDISMPGMDGYTVCKRLKADPNLESIPVVFMDAMEKTLDKVKGFDVGGTDYLTKPFELMEVLARVETHLTLARMKTQLDGANREIEVARCVSKQLHADLEGQVQRRTAELEEANKALHDIKAQFEAVYNHHYQLTGLIDKEGRLLMGNRTALEFAGVTPQDVVGKHFWETPWWTHSQEAQGVLRDAMGRAMQGEMVHFESTHISAGGETRNIDFRIGPVFDENGDVIYLVPEGYDITERKQAEEALRNSEEKYRTFFENSWDAMLMLQNDLIVDCNAAAVAALGYQNAKDLLNTHPSQISPEHQPDGRTSREKAVEMMEIAYTQGSHRFEWEHVTRNGDTFPVEISLTAIPSEGGRRLIAVWRDIADRKRAEEERVKLEAQLHQAQKMEAIGQLAGGVAHDFNNLLQAILGYGTMALEEVEAESTLHVDLEEIVKAGDRATTLVRQLLALSRKQVLRLEVLDLNEVVEDFAKMIRRVIGEHIALDIHFKPGLKNVHADRGQLEQILMNLCVNSRDAMPDGGRLTIETVNVELDAHFCRDNAWATPGKYVQLTVRDTGIGIDEETQRRIFEPFYTTKGEGEGTGLGLATVYGIVRQHQGMISVHSEIGLGATFKIYLPMSQAPIEAACDTEASEPPGGSEVILLAEDDESVRSVAKRLLEQAGYTVIAANDGEEAIGLYEHHAGKIDLALLDVVMPRCGGRSVCNHIRKKMHRCPSCSPVATAQARSTPTSS